MKVGSVGATPETWRFLRPLLGAASHPAEAATVKFDGPSSRGSARGIVGTRMTHAGVVIWIEQRQPCACGCRDQELV